MNSKGEKPMKRIRTRVTTTLDAELWHKLQIRAAQDQVNCNEILETLMAEYLKRPTKPGKAEK